MDKRRRQSREAIDAPPAAMRMVRHAQSADCVVISDAGRWTAWLNVRGVVVTGMSKHSDRGARMACVRKANRWIDQGTIK